MLERIKNFKGDIFFFGLLIGIFTPFLAFFMYWLFKYYYISFPSRFIWFLKLGGMWDGIVKLSTLTNLLPFYIFINKNKNKAAAGIMTATVMYVLYIVYLMYFDNSEY